MKRKLWLITIALALLFTMPVNASSVELREFDSREELESWRDIHIPIEADYWGYDVADYLVREAISDGYMMSYQVIYRSKIGRRRVSQTFGWHIGCLTIIKGEIYFLDTYPPYDISWVGNRDKMPVPRTPTPFEPNYGKGGKPK